LSSLSATHILRAGNEREIDYVFSTLVETPVEGLLVFFDPVYFNRRNQLVRLEAAHKIPAIHAVREFVVSGGLMSYGPSIRDAYSQAGVYAGRILKGEKAADLPVQQSTKLELIINRKTARTLGLEISPTLLALADEVIE
jgi:ABC-type uncharacterized transport system substrate-binding protein